MPTVPSALATVLAAFAPLFDRGVRGQAHALLVGAIRAPTQRTVAAAPRSMGLAHVARSHRVHGPARWWSPAVGRALRRLRTCACGPAPAAPACRVRPSCIGR